MSTPTILPHLKGYRCPRGIIAFVVWRYHLFSLSTADVEDLLAERGTIVSREAIRLSVTRFGLHFSSVVQRDRPGTADTWHRDAGVVPIDGVKQCLWRAVDATAISSLNRSAMRKPRAVSCGGWLIGSVSRVL